MSSAILTVVISTYNRYLRLKNNLEKMMSYDDDRICFLVGDNNSNDGTREYLHSLAHSRLDVRYNMVNYGFENAWLLSFDVRTPYFVFVNDRDFISQKNISTMCSIIESTNAPDIISCEIGRWKQGYKNREEFIEVYFGSRHPGTLIYNSSFCKNSLKENVLLQLIETNKQNMFNVYLVKGLLNNLSTGYSYKKYMVNQPPDREKIRQERKDYYGCSYITLNYRKMEIEDWIDSYSEYPSDDDKVILTELIKNAFYTLSFEYYSSVQIEGFKERNNCLNEEKNKWVLNVWGYARYLLSNKKINEYGLKTKVLRVGLLCYLRCIYLIVYYELMKKNGLFIGNKGSNKISEY